MKIAIGCDEAAYNLKMILKQHLESKGYVKSGGDYWRAKSISGETIEKGTPVIIEKMEGVTAFVKLKNDQ